MPDVPSGSSYSPAKSNHNQRPHAVRAKTFGRDLQYGLKRAAALYPEQPGVDYRRPKIRSECVDGPRPCPFVSCKYHLYLDVLRTGSLKLNFPDLEVDEMQETCVLDIADRGGVDTDHAVGVFLNLTREMIRRIVGDLLEQIRPAFGTDSSVFLEAGTPVARSKSGYSRRQLPLLAAVPRTNHPAMPMTPPAAEPTTEESTEVIPPTLPPPPAAAAPTYEDVDGLMVQLADSIDQLERARVALQRLPAELEAARQQEATLPAEIERLQQQLVVATRARYTVAVALHVPPLQAAPPSKPALNLTAILVREKEPRPVAPPPAEPAEPDPVVKEEGPKPKRGKSKKAFLSEPQSRAVGTGFDRFSADYAAGLAAQDKAKQPAETPAEEAKPPGLAEPTGLPARILDALKGGRRVRSDVLAKELEVPLASVQGALFGLQRIFRVQQDGSVKPPMWLLPEDK